MQVFKTLWSRDVLITPEAQIIWVDDWNLGLCCVGFCNVFNIVGKYRLFVTFQHLSLGSTKWFDTPLLWSLLPINAFQFTHGWKWLQNGRPNGWLSVRDVSHPHFPLLHKATCACTALICHSCWRPCFVTPWTYDPFYILHVYAWNYLS